jgi:ketosteroid isomerase-like protein
VSEARRVALALIERLNAGDVDGLLALVHPDVRWRVPRLDGSGDFRGLDAVRAGIFARLPLLLEAPPRMEIEDLVAEGECAVVRARGSARTRAGREHTNRYALFYRVREGRVVEVEEFLDTARAALTVFGKKLVDA